MTDTTRNLIIVAVVMLVAGIIVGGYVTKVQTTQPITISESDPLPTSSESGTRETTELVSGETVYITRSGAKYHANGCRFLSKSRIPISLSDAKERGFGPCSKCGPPG